MNEIPVITGKICPNPVLQETQTAFNVIELQYPTHS